MKELSSKEWVAKTGTASATPQLQYMLDSQLCAFDDKTDLKLKLVKKLIVWLCCPNYLMYL